MINVRAENLRRAIENLMNAKLHDALRPDGMDRLIAHRRTGVVSFDIRAAERELEELLGRVLPQECKSNQGSMRESRPMN